MRAISTGAGNRRQSLDRGSPDFSHGEWQEAFLERKQET